MKKCVQTAITALMTLILMVGLSSCTKEGPAEKAGKKIDKTIEKAGETVRDIVKDTKK